MMTSPWSLYLAYQSFKDGITCWQLMQPNVHISTMTTLPRRSARRRGASTFSQVSFISSGAGPRSGREAIFGIAESTDCAGDSFCCGAHPKRMKASNPKRKRFMIISLPDVFILRKLPYERITDG